MVSSFLLRGLAGSTLALTLWLTTAAGAEELELYGPPPPPPPKALLLHASQPGQQSYDQADGGGNPFASALIELMVEPGMPLEHLTRALVELTMLKSEGFQRPDVPDDPTPGYWHFLPIPDDETRVALVLVISDYSASHGAVSLPGARTDVVRVSQALRDAGFQTETVVDPSGPAARAVLDAFAERSQTADVALVYTTGHGVEVENQIRLLLGDFPVEQGNAALAGHAIRLSEVADAVKARRLNLVLYGGCRDNPFGR